VSEQLLNSTSALYRLCNVLPYFNNYKKNLSFYNIFKNNSNNTDEIEQKNENATLYPETIKPNISNKTKNILGADRVE